MAIFKCKMCGSTIDSDKLGTNNVCEKCGARYALKPVKKELADLYDRADALRRDCEFDSSESIYRDIISIDEKQADAYWGAVLCKYCVGCINDRDTHTRISICRGSSADSIKSDDDFLLAVEYGDNEQRSVYNSEADEIIRTQKEIFEIMSSEKPFDVFISYKETDANGKRTKDSDSAEAMYNLLVRNGLKVFYAPVTLRGENKMGRKYLTSIFAAVNSAKVMLAVGSKPEYLSAEWVKSEWSRFLELMKIDNSKILLPCFLDMQAGDLPKGLNQLQAEDITSRANEAKTANKVIDYLHPQNNSNPTVTALKKRGFMALEDGEWQKANNYFEKVLDEHDAEDAECYLGKLMIELKVKKREELSNRDKPISNNKNYVKACEFDKIGNIKSFLYNSNETILDRNIDKNLNKIYNKAVKKFMSAKTEKDYKAAEALFENIHPYKDSRSYLSDCYSYQKKFERRRKDKIYFNAISYVNKTIPISDYEKAIKKLELIADWRDSNELIESYNEKIFEIRKIKKDEKDRIKLIKKTKSYKKQEKKTMSIKAKTIIASIVSLLVFVLVWIIYEFDLLWRVF